MRLVDHRKGYALTGFMGVGKTTVGRALAERSGLPFVDLDAVIASRHGPLAPLLASNRFRALESETLRELLHDDIVLATGGGAVLDPGSRRALSENFTVCALQAPLSVCEARVDDGCTRPLWDARHRHWAARTAVYGFHHLAVDADRPVAAIVEEIHGANSHPLPLPGHTPMVTGAGFSGLRGWIDDHLHPDGLIIISDDAVAPLWAGELQRELGDVPVVVMPMGEVHKTVSTWSMLADALLERGLRRNAVVIALGGGVVGDVAGFVASTHLRGIRVVQVPTTVLAMVDSSVGGKTGVNHPSGGKNAIGTFHPPRLSWAALDTLETLPDVELRSGLAEAVKIGATHDADLLAVLALGGEMGRGMFEAVIRRAVTLKAEIVARDPREAGERRLLNAGHTLAHALEAMAGFAGLRHGEAVAMGLFLETHWAERAGLALPGTADVVTQALRGVELATHIPGRLDAESLSRALGMDKKRSGGIIKVPYVCAPGQASEADVPIGPFARELTALHTALGTP